jgi:ElaB protein
MSSERSVDAGPPKSPMLERTEVAKAIDVATIAPSSAGNGGGPAVLAQPPVTGSEGKGSAFTPARKTTATAGKETLSETRDTIRAKYRMMSDSTDDFVHESPWKAIAIAALGGILVGMLATR